LMHTHPAPGAQLVKAPRSVQLRFGEAVDPWLATVHAADARGRRVDLGAAFHPGGRGNVIAVAIAPRARGPLAVAWRIVSDDGHPEHGVLRFRVGGGPLATGRLPRLREAPASTGELLAAVRALHDVAVALALGVVLFLLFAWPRDRRAGRSAERRIRAELTGRTSRLFRRTAHAGLVLALEGAWLEGAEIAARAPFDLRSADAAIAAVGARAGCGWGVALGAWLWLLLCASRSAALRLDIPLILGVDVLVIAPVLCGHANGAMLPVAFVHVVAVAVWVGGLPALFAAASALGSSSLAPAAAARVARRVAGGYSRLALPAACPVLATGAVQALARLDAPLQLATTAYGRLLLLKLVFVSTLLALGALNRSWLLPQLRPGTAGAATRMLRRTVGAELAVAFGVFVATGVLTGAAPPG